MNTSPHLIAYWALLLVSATLAFGQQTTPVAPEGPAASTPPIKPQPAAPSPEEPPKDEILQLSPFVVTSEEDGYVASSSASGSRLKTELKDIAASVTVLTNEFLDDLGATDIASALEFAVGAENDGTSDPTGVDSLGQGFVGGDFGDSNTRSGEVRFRGLGRATTTSNYIQIAGSSDRYNSESAEVLRGANSVLFGLAEPAGLVSYRTKMASLTKSRMSLETRVDNFGSRRGVFDVNQVIKRGFLGVRAVALYAQNRYEVDTAYNDDRRYYFTTTFRPFSKTAIRAYYERVDNDGRRPNYRSVQDNVSGWLDLYNQYYGVLTPAQLAAAFYHDPVATTGAPAASSFVVNGQNVDLGTLRRFLDGGTNRTALLYDNTDWENPLFGGAILLGGRTPTGGNPAVAFRGAFARSGSPLENRTGYTDPRVNDTASFPYRTQELTALPGNYLTEKDRKFNVTLDQQILKNFFISATYQRETWNQEYFTSPIAQTQQLSLDINTRLPDGRANPNFLRPFVYGRSIGSYSDEIHDNLLIQANYDFDFAKKTKRFRWLGFHRLTGAYTKTNVDQLEYRFQQQFSSNIPGVFDFTTRDPELKITGLGPTNANRNAYQVWYIGDAVQPGDTTIRFTGLPTTTAAHSNRAFGYTYLNAANQWVQSPEPLQVSRLLVANGRNYNLRENSGFGVSLQSFFWKRKIVTLFGMRSDKVETVSRNRFPDPIDSVFLPGDSRDDFDSQTVPQVNNKRTTGTQSIVYHPTDWLRVFANRSENFAATAPRIDNLYRPLSPQSGETTEFGLGLNLLNHKLNVRATYYQSSQLYATSASATSTANLRVEVVEDRLYNALSLAGRLAEWTTFGPNGPTTEPYSRPQNIAATEDRDSKGVEMEIIYNPTRSWRMSITAGKTDAVSTNVGRELGEFLALRAPFYKTYFDEGLRQDGTNAATIPQSNSTLLSQDFRNTVASNYVLAKNLEGTAKSGVADYTGTFVTRYSFAQGFLQGFSLGINLRWENGKIAGYPQIPAIYTVGGLNEPGTIADVKAPYISNNVITGGMFIGYKRKLFDGRVNWRSQLNAQNLFSERGIRVIAAQPDGSPIYGVARPLTLVFSNTFDF